MQTYSISVRAGEHAFGNQVGKVALASQAGGWPGPCAHGPRSAQELWSVKGGSLPEVAADVSWAEHVD
jgi:hypothetical protein